MANRIWQSSDGDWGNTASWSGAAVPISNDVAIFPANNSVAVTSGLAQVAVDLDALVVQEGYTPDIGLTGTHLTISADKVLHEGLGTLFYTDGDGTTDQVIINSPNKVAAAVLSGTSITRLTALRGKTTCDASLAALALLEIGFVTARNTDAEVVLQTGAGTVTDLYQNGGVLTSQAIITNAYVGAGILTQGLAVAITNLHQFAGQVVYKSSATIALANIIGGMFDGSRDAARPFTITLLKVFPGATAMIPTDIVTVTAGGQVLDRSVMG